MEKLKSKKNVKTAKVVRKSGIKSSIEAKLQGQLWSICEQGKWPGWIQEANAKECCGSNAWDNWGMVQFLLGQSKEKKTELQAQNQLKSILMNVLNWKTSQQGDAFNISGSVNSGKNQLEWSKAERELPSGGLKRSDIRALRVCIIGDIMQGISAKGEFKGLEKEWLYGGEWPAQTVIKEECELIAKEWQEPSWDLWNEKFGFHFLNGCIQYRALGIGKEYAEKFGDKQAGEYYQQQRDAIKSHLGNFYDTKQKGIQEGLDIREELYSSQGNGFGITTILGNLLLGSRDSLLGIFGTRTMESAWRIIQDCEGLYTINQDIFSEGRELMGAAIGRYNGDSYDGRRYGKKGTAWSVANGILAEWCFRFARETQQRKTWSVRSKSALELVNYVLRFGNRSKKVEEVTLKECQKITNTSALGKKIGQGFQQLGEALLVRVYANSLNGQIASQIDGNTGRMKGDKNSLGSVLALVNASQAQKC